MRFDVLCHPLTSLVTTRSRLASRQPPGGVATLRASGLLVALVWLHVSAPAGIAQTKGSDQTSAAKAQPRAPDPTSTVKTFVPAIQARDFKSVVRVMDYYQQEIFAIKKANPSFLHQKLIDEYVTDKVSRLSAQAGYWQSYGEALGGMTGDPAATIRSAVIFLPPSARWKIVEVKKEQVSDSLLYGPHTRVVAYLMVDYAAPNEAPTPGDKPPLKQTALELNLRAESGLVLGMRRIEQADVFFPVPPLDAEAAVAVLEHGIPVLAKHAYLAPDMEACPTPCFKVPLPVNRTPALDTYLGMLRRHGLALGEIKIQGGWGANAVTATLPESWSELLLGREGNKAFYALTQRALLSIQEIKQSERIATTRVTVVRGGCTPACQLLADYWNPAFRSKIDMGRDWIFTALWGEKKTYGRSAGAAQWPPTSELEAVLAWSPVDSTWGLRSWKILGHSQLEVVTGGTAPSADPGSSAPATVEPAVTPGAHICANGAACDTAGYMAIKGQQYEVADAAYRRALSLGGTVGLNVCQLRAFTCARGMLRLSKEQVSFTEFSGKKVAFSVQPSQVAAVDAEDKVSAPSSGKRAYTLFRIRIQDKEHKFVFLSDTRFEPGNPPLFEDPGPAQQQAVAKFVVNALPALAKGVDP